MKEIEIEGKSVEEAIQTGLKQTGLKRENVQVRILNEGKSGLFGLMGASPAKIKIIIGDEEKNIDYKRLEEQVKEILSQMLKYMDIEGSINATVFGGRIIVDIITEDGMALIGQKGKTIDALTTVVNLIIGKKEKIKIKMDIDVNNYKAEKKDKIQELAKKIAEDVKKDGREREMKLALAYERKFVHLALERIGDIETFSKGVGENRRVIIKLKNNVTFK